MRNELPSGGNPGEKSAGRHADHRVTTSARSSEGGNDGQALGVTIQSREPVDSNPVSVGAASLEQSISAKGVDPHRPSTIGYCRKCGSFDIEPYVR